jgi:hypothetical protein
MNVSLASLQWDKSSFSSFSNLETIRGKVGSFLRARTKASHNPNHFTLLRLRAIAL